MIEWQNNPPEEPMTWHNAVEYAKSLGDGWRLPTRAELIDAYDNKIEDFDFSYYWSSSTYAQNTNNAWYVNFNNGNVNYNAKTNYDCVRCVRDVKGKDVDPLKLDPSCIIIDRGE